MLRLFPKLGLLDFPERYGLKRARLPYPTGILAIATFLVCFSLITTWNMQAVGLIAGSILLLGTACIDDRMPLPAWLRLGIQVLTALIIFATGSRIYTMTNPLEGFFGLGSLIKLDTMDLLVPFFGPLPIWSGIFTVLWLGLTINALNWFDGIPGQVSALSTIGFLTIGFLSLSARVNQPELAGIAFVLTGISLACILFDFPPPRVIMGDSGSMFFGLMLGVLTLYSGGKVATAFLVLGVPLIDSVIVVVRRLLRGQSIFHGSAGGEHLHHRLLERGWAPQKIILLTVLLGGSFGITALFLSTKGKFLAALILALIMLVLSISSGKTSADKTAARNGCS
ncbi:MAG: MraY family glycosyltransferase [Candidatus Peregrinibacteria bacterium]